ncbi:MAG: hypothetical protein ICV87_07085, partial [Gemmatimonadetes bacterium]|nr:hypothetical protein [Gemmatimonadota bacterium]
MWIPPLSMVCAPMKCVARDRALFDRDREVRFRPLLAPVFRAALNERFRA